MRLSPGAIANAAAWLVVGVLIVASFLVTNRLGFVGLSLLGVLTWLVCTLGSLHQKVPTWGAEVFRAAMERPRSAEDKAASHAEHEATMSPLRFYARCGAFLAVIGIAGFVWQSWSGSQPH